MNICRLWFFICLTKHVLFSDFSGLTNCLNILWYLYDLALMFMSTLASVSAAPLASWQWSVPTVVKLPKLKLQFLSSSSFCLEMFPLGEHRVDWKLLHPCNSMQFYPSLYTNCAGGLADVCECVCAKLECVWMWVRH